MSNISSKNGNVKVFRDGNWIDVNEIPFPIQANDLVQCFDGAWFRLQVGNNIFIHLADSGDTANRCFIAEGSSYYYPRR